jgi:hypothetical protein
LTRPEAMRERGGYFLRDALGNPPPSTCECVEVYPASLCTVHFPPLHLFPMASIEKKRTAIIVGQFHQHPAIRACQLLIQASQLTPIHELTARKQAQELAASPLQLDSQKLDMQSPSSRRIASPVVAAA